MLSNKLYEEGEENRSRSFICALGAKEPAVKVALGMKVLILCKIVEEIFENRPSVRILVQYSYLLGPTQTAVTGEVQYGILARGGKREVQLGMLSILKSIDMRF